MNKDILNYWIEAVESALEEVEKLDVFSKEDIINMAETLQISSEQESMAFGTEAIPNPLESEIRNIRSRHEKEISEFEKRDLIFRKNIANRHGPRVGPENVHIEGGNVEYDPQ